MDKPDDTEKPKADLSEQARIAKLLADSRERDIPVNAVAPRDGQINALAHGAEVFKYGLVQAPITAVSQVVDKVTGGKLEERTRFMSAPAPAAHGSSAWVAEVGASTLAGAVPLVLFHRAVGAGSITRMEVAGKYAATDTMSAMGKSAALGLAWGGLATPTAEDRKDNMLKDRAASALSFGSAFATMTGGAAMMKKNAIGLLRTDMAVGTVTGGAGGALSADVRSLVQDNRLATGQERWQAASTFALGGLMMGGATTMRENTKNGATSGIPGVRTPQDMTRLADTTVKPGHPERYIFEQEQRIPAKADVLMAEAQGQALPDWHNRASVLVRQEINSSNIPVDARKLVVSGFQEMSYGLEALHTRSNPKDVIVVYGSARFPESDFRYQRARYIGGRAVQEGYDVMTGGGPGTMEAANRGAYEAGGTSIGVVLKLPHEKRGNGYQTLTLKHRNFHTRMEMLKQGDIFVVEDGGIGTAAEALDTLTHIQTGKLKDSPVYLVGRRNYELMDTWLKSMEKSGTISPSDRKLYKMVEHPDDIFKDLAMRKAAKMAESQPKT